MSSELRARTSRGRDYCLLEALSPYTGQEAVKGLLLCFWSDHLISKAGSGGLPCSFLARACLGKASVLLEVSSGTLIVCFPPGKKVLELLDRM